MRDSKRCRLTVETLEQRLALSASHAALAHLHAMLRDEPPGPPPPPPPPPPDWPRTGGIYYGGSIKEKAKHSTVELDYVWNNGATYATRLNVITKPVPAASSNPSLRIYGDFGLVATELARAVAGQQPVPTSKGTIEQDNLSIKGNDAFYTLVIQTSDGYTYSNTVTVTSRSGPNGLPDPSQWNLPDDLMQFSTSVNALYPPPS